MLVHRARSNARRTFVVAVAALAGCSTPRAPAGGTMSGPRTHPSETAARAGAEPADAGRVEPPSPEESLCIDYGDGPTNMIWGASRRTLTVESLPPLDVDDAEKPECLHLTGVAGVHDETPPVLVVLSVLYGPETCGTMLGRSIVYGFDGRAWTKVVTTVGSELHLRQDGPDVVEWKLVSAEAPYDASKWSKIARKKFPPAEPRATAIRSFGFEKP